MKNNKILIWLVGVALLLVAVIVFVFSGRTEQPDQIAVQPDSGEAVAVVDTEVPTTNTQEAAEPTQEEMEDEVVVPEPRTGLESTDPANVNLASGDIQLVEVFAFW